MRAVWIVLIAFTFAFFTHGHYLSSRDSKEAIPSESIKLRPEGTTGDFTGTGFYANDKQSSNLPSWGTQRGTVDGKETHSQIKLINQLKDPYVHVQIAKDFSHRLKSKTSQYITSRHKSKERQPHTESEQNVQTLPSNEWDTDAPQDTRTKLETHVQSPSDTVGDSGASEEEDSESETDELTPEDNEWDSGTPEGEGHESEIDELSPEDIEFDSGTPEDEGLESETDELTPEDNEWDSGTPDDEEPESETDESSPEDTEFDSGTPEDEGLESETDELSPEDTEIDSETAEDEESHSETDELSPEDTEFDSGTPDDEEPESETDELSPEDIGIDSETAEDEESHSETDELSPEDTEFDSGTSDDKEPESETDELSPEDTEWDTGTAPGAHESKEMRLRQYKSTLQTTPESLSSADANKVREQLYIERKKETLNVSDTETTQLPPKSNKSGQGKAKGSQQKISKKKAKMLSPGSQHWTSFSMVHGRNRDMNLNIQVDPNWFYKRGLHIKARKQKKTKKQSSGAVVAAVITLSVIGGLLLVLLMAAFLAFVWPIRKYFEKLSKQVDRSDTDSGRHDDSQLSSIRVDRTYPPLSPPVPPHPAQKQEPIDDYELRGIRNDRTHPPLSPPVPHHTAPKQEPTDDSELSGIRNDKTHPPLSPPVPHHPAPKQEPTTTTAHQAQVIARPVLAGSGCTTVCANKQLCPSEVPKADQTKTTSKKIRKHTKEEVISEDKKRDSRNAERRKIIKKQTSKRRDSLIDSILIAKAVIEGQAKNKKYEKKASERRRVIKECTCASKTCGEKKRRVSFSEELQTGCSVITPNSDLTKSLERSKKKCRKIKTECSLKRRPSLAEEIEVAKEVIVDSEKKGEIPPVIVKEAVVEKVKKKKSSRDSEGRKVRIKQPTTSNIVTSNQYSSQDVELDEMRRGFTRYALDSDEEANWNLV